MGSNTVGNNSNAANINSRPTVTADELQRNNAPEATTTAAPSTSDSKRTQVADGVDRGTPVTSADANSPANATTRNQGTGVLPFQVADLLPSADVKGSGPKGPARAEVADLLAAYDKPRLGRPAERLVRWGAKIDTLIGGAAKANGGDVSKVVDVMMDKDIRRQVFLLEGGLKFYKKAHPELEPLLVQSKALEDVLGHVKGANTMLALAKEKGAPKAVLDVMSHHADDARSRLETLVKKEWMPDGDGQIPAITTLLDTLETVPWMSYKDDKAFVKQEFGRRLKKMGKVEYKMDELQGDFGVHELRRNLRWIPIYAEALDGLVQTDPKNNPVKAYKPMLKEDIADSKFLRLPDGDFEKKPLGVSKSLYAANMQLVLDFGSLKDRGEEVEELALAFGEAGLAPKGEDPGPHGHPVPSQEAVDLALDLLGLDASEPTRLTDEAGKLFDKMSDNKLFKAMRKDYEG